MEATVNRNVAAVNGNEAEGGNMAALVASKDWSETSLGPIEDWPQSLRTTVSLCLASNFPISIAWGPQRVQIYNDGYWPICGDKHPASMGQDFKECWLSAWPVIGEAFEQASLGQTRFLENQRIFIDRFGYLEETFFTFSFSPIIDESGGVGGLFHPVTELTQQMLAERRLDILRTVADRTVDARTVEETATLILDTLKSFELDLPFVLLYALSANGKTASLAGSAGVERSSPLAEEKIALDTPADRWRFSDLVQNGKHAQIDELDQGSGSFSCGPYPECPKTALAFPLYISGAKQPQAFLVAGVSSRRALDEKYRLFYGLLAGAVSNALTKAAAYEEERKRAEALAELDRVKTTFFSNISHEFRTPLTLMLGPLEDSLADRAHPLPQEQQARLELVQRNTLRLQRLVNSLLDFSRIESGRLKASFQKTDLAHYTADLASVFHSAMEKAGLQFNVDCPPLEAPVFVDHEMWEQIVFNLLSNALKFTFAGSIDVRLKEEGESVVLTVSDTGEGIAAAELKNLFKRFYRIEGTKSRTHEGSGIGLAFVQELVKLHGGSISAESELGKGTTFTVSIPTGSAHLPPASIAQNQTSKTAGRSNVYLNESMGWLEDTSTLLSGNGMDAGDDENSGAAANILVVDDNKDMLHYVTNILSQNKAWAAQTADNGVAALEAISRQKPDLILSDVMMPQLDGFGLLRKLKENPETARIPIIFLSARAGEESVLEGLEKGADDYLVKPFSARELLARVRTQLEITKTRQDNTELRTTEEELKKFKILSDHAFDAFILMRQDGSFAYLNNLALQRWGYTAEEAKTLRVPDVDPIYQQDKFDEVFALAQRLGALQPFETLHKRKDGTIYPVEVAMGGMTLDGEPHMFAVARDITERKKIETEIKEREERFRTLAESLPQLVWMTDEAGKQEYASSSWKEYSGLDCNEEEMWEQIVFPEDMPTMMAIWQRCLLTGEDYYAEARLKNREGQYRWHAVQGEPLRDEEGRIRKWIGAFTDIQDQKTISEKLQDLVSERTTDLERSNYDLQQFAHVASHDLKEPIRKIKTFAGMLVADKSSVLSVSAKTYLQKMNSAVDRMFEMIEGVLAYSTLNAIGKENGEIDLNKVIADIESDLELLIQQKGATIEYSGLPRIEGGETLIYQLFYNLVNNALKFSSPDRPPRISISASMVQKEGTDYAKILVADNGIGFEPAYAERIFATFTRLNPKDRYEGTGLGLALCKKIVERHGGTIMATGEPEKGATFTILLPKAQADAGL